MSTIAAFTMAVAVVSPAFAGGPNRGRVWESGFRGINVNAEIYIQPSYNDGGKHAAGGQVHLWRQAGPAVNVCGCTAAATSRTDSHVYHVKKTVRDSLRRGDKYIARGSYKTLWFSSGVRCVIADDWAPAYEAAVDPESPPATEPSFPEDAIPAADSTSDAAPDQGPPPC